MYLAGLIVVAGVTGFYLIPESQGFLRILAMVVALLLAGGAVWWSQPGRDFAVYARDSIAEGRKVVWPSRKEAMQVTGMVFLFVTVLALFMWAVDSGLSWLFYDVILGRG
jgi:preprotein translocase subunit SecE